MQLYSRLASPYAARVRISLNAKNIACSIIDGPDTKSDAFAKLNPLGKVPVLVLDDGTALAESEVIVEYLEDAFPQTPLRPADALGRARVKLIPRLCELYLFPAVINVMMGRGEISAVSDGLAQLEAAHDGKSWHAYGDSFTTADAALASFLFYINVLSKRSGQPLLDAYPKLTSFWAGATVDALLSATLQEMGEGLRARTGG